MGSSVTFARQQRGEPAVGQGGSGLSRCSRPDGCNRFHSFLPFLGSERWRSPELFLMMPLRGVLEAQQGYCASIKNVMIDSRIWPAAVVEEACSTQHSRKWNILRHLLTMAAALRDHDKHYPENIWHIHNLCADSASDADGVLVILPPRAQYHLFRRFGSRTRSLLFSAPGVWFMSCLMACCCCLWSR